MSDKKPLIGVVGGSGDLGSGLAWRWAKAGYPIVIGSRMADKGERVAAEMVEQLGGDVQITGSDNAGAAAQAEIVVLTVPYENHRPMLEGIVSGLKGKILVDVTVPLRPPKVGRVQLPEAGCAAQEAQDFLGEDVRVVAAFQNVGAEHLKEDHKIDCDVLVSGDNVEAREQVIALVEATGMKGWHAGPVANSAAAEALTSILIQINRRYKIAGSGIRITGTPGETA
ncbi:MAG: NADPH-dependent F420 reductase [Pseudomonadota bacterium]